MKTILIVDDAPALLSLVSTVVQSAKHASFQANCGEAALELLKRIPELDALITDIRMPGMNGFALAHAVRIAKPKIPILFISGYFDSDEQDHMQWIAESRVSFLPKPFLPAKLLHELNSLLLT
ncbi:MAG: multi-sensor hybrid histidine kinase [Fibrobacteres bacterium]|nr:multi-sensor hybrid histidine kinase [Fibrobacterota bacterium]